MIFNKKGQVAIFVIIALIIVGGIVTFFVFREQLFGAGVSAEFRPVFDYYKSCIEAETKAAIDLAGSQGGRIFVDSYLAGSEYAPSSSQLNFLGFPVPYWFYISGNGLVKESVPTKAEIQNEISQYISERVNDNCNFNDFYAKGFSVTLSAPVVKTTISESNLIVNVDSDMVVLKEDGASARVRSHNINVGSSFGKLYATAREIYSKEKTESFLENYSIDVLRNYAPVDGVEISCSGNIWKTREVIDEFKGGLEANIGAIKFEGDYYTQTADNKYFVVDLPVNQQVNLIYSRTWPTKVEISGADDELMIAEPVGTQEGLGTMGFCYAPYHFVYDVSYPVLVQVLEGNEIFQFPVVVVIDKNAPRLAQTSPLPFEGEEVDLCQFNTQDVEINVYDTGLNRVDANLSLLCYNQECRLGSTTNGVFSGSAPACYNSYLKVKSEGYAEKRQLFSTNEERFLDVIIDREYNVEINLEVGESPLDGTAIITFNGDRSVSTFLPDAANVKLSEGLYNITVYAYGNSSLTIPGSTKTQCHETAQGGLLGLFGTTKEECVDITIPETKIEMALIGGGRSEIYILPTDLAKGELKLKVDSLPKPGSLEDLQNNFAAFDVMRVELAV